MTESLHLSEQIDRPADEVYRFVADPAHLPRWAAGVPDGVEVRFAPTNPFGVLDHDVTLPDGTTVTNPMRVIADGEGCEVVFTLRRGPGMSEEAFAADQHAVRRDLGVLRRLMES